MGVGGMTDEEKAMTQFKNTICANCKDKDVCDVSILDCAYYDSIYGQAYLDGLAEGRKEQDIKDLQEQLVKIKMVASSWIMSLEDVRASEVNNRRFEVLRELEKRVTEC